jgi:hypothetical protein
MKSRIGALAVLVFALACSSATAAPASVELRIEGSTGTIFEQTVVTDAHEIEQDKNGPQKCDGTNGGANATAGPTITTALDDAVAWDGNWTPSLSDFLVNRIGADRNNENQFWGTALNGQIAQAGGCQVHVKDGDEVLWAFDLFSAKQLLRLSGPKTAKVGRPFTVKVIDTLTDRPVKGANVAGVKTDKRGNAKLEYSDAGELVLKAERRKAIRSNALVVRVR